MAISTDPSTSVNVSGGGATAIANANPNILYIDKSTFLSSEYNLRLNETHPTTFTESSSLGNSTLYVTGNVFNLIPSDATKLGIRQIGINATSAGGNLTFLTTEKELRYAMPPEGTATGFMNDITTRVINIDNSATNKFLARLENATLVYADLEVQTPKTNILPSSTVSSIPGTNLIFFDRGGINDKTISNDLLNTEVDMKLGAITTYTDAYEIVFPSSKTIREIAYKSVKGNGAAGSRGVYFRILYWNGTTYQQLLEDADTLPASSYNIYYRKFSATPLPVTTTKLKIQVKEDSGTINTAVVAFYEMFIWVD